MIPRTIVITGFMLILTAYMTTGAMAQPPLTKCSIQPQIPNCATGRSHPTPRCGIEMTCTDRPVQLGYSDGVCFRASCPGIWALLHKRVDQASFRFRTWTYRHYTFKGYWQLKDQGALRSGPVELRALFLVLPDDLIEFRLQDPDKYARVELRNLGYVKRGDLCELKKWLALQAYREGPALIQTAMDRNKAECDRARRPPCGPMPGSCLPFGKALFGNVLTKCRYLGLPF